MLLCFTKLVALLLLAFLICSNCIAQNRSKKFAQELFAEVREDEKLVAECEQKVREYQIAKFGKVLPKITGDFCFGVCPTRLALPDYPREAKRFRFSGSVMVETIVDENGKVIYARTIEGKPFLSQAAERVAYRSSFMPIKACDKPIKFRAMIAYNFILNR